jgi:hypothetical protein
VAVTDHDDPADRDDDERDQEETKRLLYVALTRARDRLYLGATLTGGKLIVQRGSIGKVLPASLTAALAAGAESDQITWPASAAAHVIRRVRFSLP